MRLANSLLRIDSVSGEPPPPFEHPNPKMGFWVLELWRIDQDLEVWCNEIVKTLQTHRQMLEDLNSRGARITLCVGTLSDEPVARFETTFLLALAALSVSLEVIPE